MLITMHFDRKRLENIAKQGLRRGMWAVFSSLCAVLILSLPAGQASAQIAVARLSPASLSINAPHTVPDRAGIIPINPAVLQWASPSLVSVGYLKTKSTWVAPVRLVPERNFEGAFGGGRFVGENFSIAGEVVILEDKETDVQITANTNAVAGAFQIGNTFAMGAASRASTNVHSEFTLNTVSDTSNITEVGISLQLIENWFIGVSLGSEQISRTAVHVNDTTFDEKRDIVSYGLGFRSGGAVLVHLEIGVIEAATFEINGVKSSGRVTNLGVVEFNVFNILLGYSAATTSITGTDRELSIIKAEIGFVPTEGIAITLLQQTIAEDDPTLGLEYEHVTSAVALSYQFF